MTKVPLSFSSLPYLNEQLELPNISLKVVLDSSFMGTHALNFRQPHNMQTNSKVFYQIMIAIIMISSVPYSPFFSCPEQLNRWPCPLVHIVQCMCDHKEADINHQVMISVLKTFHWDCIVLNHPCRWYQLVLNAAPWRGYKSEESLILKLDLHQGNLWRADRKLVFSPAAISFN